MNPASEPVPPEDLHGDGRWISMHERFLEETKSWEPDVLLIGDSLIRNLTYTELWSRSFVPLHSLNFGIGGDQTQHVLWRVTNGELEHIRPKVIVLLVGTNNIGHSPEQISDGIIAIVRVIQQKQPQAYLVILSLLPRGQRPNKLRERNERVNELLATKLTGEQRVQILNVSKDLVQVDGSISALDMDDYLHLTSPGYVKSFSPLLDLLGQLLTEGEPEHLLDEEDDSSGSASALPPATTSH